MELHFEPDSGQIKQPQRELASESIDGFEADTGARMRHGYDSTSVIWHLTTGWGIGQIKPHAVDDGHLLPSARCLMETFGVSSSTAYKVLSKIRSALKIHKIDLVKRERRGDVLTRAYNYQKGLQRGLHQFFWFYKKLVREARCI